MTGIVLGAANLAAFSLMRDLWQFDALVVGLAFTSLGASPLILSKIVQGWFDRRLGIAFGILFSCASVGAVLHPLIITAVMREGGWRRAFLVMGAMALIGGLLATLTLVRQRAGPVRASAPTQTSSVVDKLPVFALLRNRTWWTLAAWNALFGFGSGAISIHYAALLHDRGIDATVIGLAVSLIGASLFVGNLLAGWLVDRISAQADGLAAHDSAVDRRLAAPGRSAACAASACRSRARPRNRAATDVWGAFLVRHYFGARLYGQASSTQLLANALGSGLSPWLSGLMRDRTGDYTLSLTYAAAAFALAIVAGWLLPQRGHQEAVEDASGALPVHV